jgi:hypothetical protein
MRVREGWTGGRMPSLVSNESWPHLTCTDTSSGMRREFWMDLTASSAVNFPITSASLRLVVMWMGVGSTRCTYLGAPPRSTFTINFVFFIVFHYSLSSNEERGTNITAFSEHHPSQHKSVRDWKGLKEVLATHGHRTSSVPDLEFPSFREAYTQSLF